MSQVMASEDGEVFIKSLAQFVRTHEVALAAALQLQRQPSKASTKPISGLSNSSNGKSTHTASTSSTLATALSLGMLNFTSQNVKTAKLTLTPHHLFYLLSRFEDLGVDVGSMNVRVENLHTESSPANYVSFLSQPPKSKGRSDRDSIHSVSSVRSVMSNMSSFWSNLSIGGSSAAKTEKAQAQLRTDLKYLYSAFTMIPCLRLSPDRKARLISGYEEFPFDTAVPLMAFKNVSALEICDLDYRSFFGWDRMADQLRSLTIKRGKVDDPLDLLVHIVLDDMDKRRRRLSRSQGTPPTLWPASPPSRYSDMTRQMSSPSSPVVQDPRFSSSTSPRNSAYLRGDTEVFVARGPRHSRNKSLSPSRPSGNHRPSTGYRHVRGSSEFMKRSESGSSNSSTHSLSTTSKNRSSSNLLSMGILPASKWRFLRHLCLADNDLTSLTASGLSPLANSLVSLDLSSNLFTEVPDSLAILTSLRALNLSNCMIKSLHSLARNPLPAITALNLRSNRLVSIAGVERLFSLERLDLRGNKILDPTEMARLTGIPEIREIWVSGNPFVKSHGNYRVTIFNLFRGTPGYTEDIVIDSTGPSYGERRQLRERATETTAPPAVRPPSVDFDAIPELTPKKSTVEEGIPGDVLLGHRPLPQTTQSEAVSGSGRRRKGPRRRIVDLADEAQPKLSRTPSNSSKLTRTPSVVHTPRKTTEARISVSLQQPSFLSLTHNAPRESRIATSTELPAVLKGDGTIHPPPGDDPFVSQPNTTAGKTEDRISSTHITSRSIATNLQLDASDNASLSLENGVQQSNLGGEAYRQKVQALKDEFGSGWLRMLGDEGWQLRNESQARDGGYPTSTTASIIRPDLSIIRTPSQSIVSGSRTLG